MRKVLPSLRRSFRRLKSLWRSLRLFRAGAFLFLLLFSIVMPGGCQCAPSPPDADTTPLPPSAGQAVGATLGDFAVSAAGKPQYTLPIVVPPGRAGLTPHLALAYSGGRNRSSLGRGFSLQGISAIGRCGSSMAQDGRRRGVALDAGDHFCLEGRRLVEFQRNVAGPGGNATEYRTRPDSGARVLGYQPHDAAADAVDYFEVQSASGLIATYGRSPESRQMGAHGVVRAFWLSEEHDRSGNAVTYHYQRRADEGDGHTLEIQPLRIDYTASVDSSGSVVTAGSRHVEFGYTTDPTRGDLFYRGLKVRSEQVLSSIRTKVDDRAVRTYWLSTVPIPAGPFSFLQDFVGDDTLRRDLLEHVTECPGDGNNPATCRPATQFNWSTRPFDGSFAADDELDGTLAATTHVPTVKEDEHYAWLLADVTGDGLADIVEAKAGPGHTVVWSVVPNLGGIFGPPSTWTQIAVPPGFGPGTGEWTLGVLDYDDDGVADILLDYLSPRAAGEWTTLQVLVSRPAGPTPHFLLTDTGMARAQTRGDSSVYPHYDGESVAAWMLADLNGDGKADLVQCEDPSAESPRSTPTATA
jgi:hypothetical protein